MSDPEKSEMGRSKSMDKRLIAQGRRAVVVDTLTQPGSQPGGAVINLNDPAQTGDGHWMRQRCIECGLGRTNHPDETHVFTPKGEEPSA